MKKLSLDKWIENANRDWPFVMFATSIILFIIWKLTHSS